MYLALSTNVYLIPEFEDPKPLLPGKEDNIELINEVNNRYPGKGEGERGPGPVPLPAVGGSNSSTNFNDKDEANIITKEVAGRVRKVFVETLLWMDTPLG